MMSAMNTPAKLCNSCGGSHESQDCQVGNPFSQNEQANYMGNFQRGQGNSYGNPYSHNYNPNWRTSHPNMSWSNNSNAQQPQQQRFDQQQRQGPNDMFARYVQENDARMKNQEASIKNIETQIGQLTS